MVVIRMDQDRMEPRTIRQALSVNGTGLLLGGAVIVMVLENSL